MTCRETFIKTHSFMLPVPKYALILAKKKNALIHCMCRGMVWGAEF